MQQMTQEDLAYGICSVSYLSKIEHESIKPSDEIYDLLGKRLGLELSSLNDTFDNVIYERLHSWHDSIKRKDFTTMKDIYQSVTESLRYNFHIDLNNLYMIFEFRYAFTLNILSNPQETLIILHNMAETSNLEFKYYYHKILGIYHLSEHELDKALDELKLAKATIIDLPIDDSELYYHIALVYSKLGNFAESIIYAQKALDMYQTTLNYTKVIECCMLIAINYNLLHVYEIAEEYFHKILHSANGYLTNVIKARVYHNLGYICINNNQYSEASDYLETALALKEQENINATNTLYLLALHSKSQDELAKAKEFSEMGYIMATKYDDKKYMYKHMMLLNQIEGTHTEEAFIQLLTEEIIPYFDQVNETAERSDALKLLGAIHFDNKKYKLAAQYFKIASQNNFKGKGVIV
ncbi:tetratricopeptide (TPR) repeat protein [Thalassobacillus pellis]|nr:tetratricopeptide repeat protein [Thalassobacillus pellis]MBM7554342.1 tetratricopeptide (TPR) repeat protein [Thalassobacillus pellis]